MSEAPVIDIEPEKGVPEPEAGGKADDQKSSKAWWQVWKRRAARPPRRSVLVRLFGIGFWGWVRLVLLCISVGFIMLTMQFDAESPEFGAVQTVRVFFQNFVGALSWTIQNSWKPGLLGAGIVLPVWGLWRLVSLPFRR